ncbi:MAG: T9SS type A sorting domain-containing protein [Bacteroidales bacterium]
MKKFTLLTAFVVLVSFAFAQVVGVHTPAKDKQKFEKVQKEENTLPKQNVIWEVTFEEDPAVWTFGHSEGSSDWIVSDTIITGIDYENCVDFNDDWLPCGTMVSSMWLYVGHRDLGEYSESGGNFAWIDGITDLLTGTEEIKDAWIQFDSIDFSGVNNPKLTFYQNYKHLNAAYSYLDISLDGGANFTEEILLNDGVEGNSYGDDFYEIILTDYIANESNVSLRFRWQTTQASINGYGYGWEIDDIKIVDNYDVDMKLQGIYMNFFEYIDYTVAGQQDYFHYSSHYGMIPINQFNSNDAFMVFNAKVENGGNLDNTPELQVRILDPNNNEVYNESALGDILSVTEKDTVDLLTPEFKPDPPVVGKYTVIFNINIANKTVEDENPDNNTDTTYFIITEDTLARDLGNMTSFTGPSAWLDGGVDGDMLGTNYLFLDDTDSIKSMSVYIASNTDPGTSIVGHLMQYDADLTQWQDIMTTSVVNINEDSIGKWIDLEFPEVVPVVLEEGAFSVKAAVEFFYNGDDNELMIGYDGTVPASSWGATWYLNQGSLAGEWYSISNWSRGGVGIRLNLTVNENAVNEINTEKLSVYPNPSTGIVKIDNVEGNDIEVFNLMGQCVFSDKNVDNNFKLNLSNQSEGTYLIRVIGTNGVKIQKINLIK